MSTQIVWEAENIGVEHAQNLQPRSTTFTSWDHVFIGTSTTNAHDAFEDATDQAAWADVFEGVDFENVKNPYNADDPDFDPDVYVCEDSELYYYVAFWVRVVEDPRHDDRIDCGDGMVRYVDSVQYVPERVSWLVTDWANNEYLTNISHVLGNQVFWVGDKTRDWSA